MCLTVHVKHVFLLFKFAFPLKKGHRGLKLHSVSERVEHKGARGYSSKILEDLNPDGLWKRSKFTKPRGQ